MTNVCERPPERLEDLAWLIDAEYREMPGMSLTFAQAKRLWNLSNEDCRTALEYLVSTGRLIRRGDLFCRRPDAR
jgi:hypothetical protein